jgi:small GTP-binding protein
MKQQNKSNNIKRRGSDIDCHVVILGLKKVGKTCLVHRLIYNRFNEGYDATVDDTHRTSVGIKGMQMELYVQDITGDRRLHMRSDLYKEAISSGDAFVLVYSVDSKASFKEVESLRKQIIEQKDIKDVPIIVIGNKADVEKREVLQSDVDLVQKVWKCKHIEVSAKLDQKVERVFHELLTDSSCYMEMTPATSNVSSAKRNKLFKYKGNKAGCAIL